MSLPKKRSSSVELSIQQSRLKQKLSAVDKHIRRSENLPATLFMHPELLQHMLKQPIIHETSNEITIRNTKSFLFNERDFAKFYFLYASITPDKRYILKVEPSHTELEVYVQLDGKRKVCYIVDKPRGILIQEMSWSKAEFTVIAKVRQKLSTAKFQIDTLIVDHKVKIHGIPSQRKIVEKQMNQYLKKNLTKEKIAQILEKRRRKSEMFSRNSNRAKTSSGYSTARAVDLHQTSRIFRSYSGFNESTSLIRSTSAVVKQPRIQSTQSKRDLRQFQNSKNKYLKHIQKMDREKADEINKNRHSYESQKKETLQKVSSSTIAIIFMHRILKQSIKISKQRIKNVQINLLCKKFIKNLIHANKLRLANRVRNKISVELNLSAIASIMWKQSRKKAQERIMARMKVNLFMIDIKNAAIQSQKYIDQVIKIQRRFRKVDMMYKLRFIVLSQYIKGYKCKDQKDLEDFFKKYKKFCYTKSKKLKFGFTKYHKQIDQIMKDLQTQN